MNSAPQFADEAQNNAHDELRCLKTVIDYEKKSNIRD